LKNLPAKVVKGLKSEIGSVKVREDGEIIYEGSSKKLDQIFPADGIIRVK